MFYAALVGRIPGSCRLTAVIGEVFLNSAFLGGFFVFFFLVFLMLPSLFLIFIDHMQLCES